MYHTSARANLKIIISQTFNTISGNHTVKNNNKKTTRIDLTSLAKHVAAKAFAKAFVRSVKSCCSYRYFATLAKNFLR